MKTFAFPRLKVLMAIIPASLVISSCSNSDLKTAQKFGELSEQLGNLNSAVAKEIYDSCARSSAWLAQGTAETRNNMRTGLQDCDKDFRPNSVNFETAGNILIEYVRAVGTLATENREAVQTSFDEIETALNGIKIERNVVDATTGASSPEPFKLSSEAVTAGVNIAEFITNFLLADFRHSQ
jgi:outer membrane murein-binding lipoprotein Lpp